MVSRPMLSLWKTNSIGKRSRKQATCKVCSRAGREVNGRGSHGTLDSIHAEASVWGAP